MINLLLSNIIIDTIANSREMFRQKRILFRRPL